MELHGEELFDYMLANLGSPDGELRDELIYRLLVKLLSGQALGNKSIDSCSAGVNFGSLFICINW